MSELQKLLVDVQAWISAGNFMMGYPAHDHIWTLDDGVALTNPPIRHRRCESCGLVQERYEYDYPADNGRVSVWRFDEFENIGKLVDRLSALAGQEKRRVTTQENATVREVWPSYYWPENAVVIVTECGHKHVRPITMKPKTGAAFYCPFCEELAALDTQKEKPAP